jgi:type IX secretion system PorP/SprF family membrane protein
LVKIRNCFTFKKEISKIMMQIIKTRNKIVLFALLFLAVFETSTAVFAQEDSQYTNYMYNTIAINPAYSGSRGVMSVFGMHRNQWMGFDGAPITNVVSINTPIYESNLGVGISFVNDKIGPSTENSISADISYAIRTSENYKLAFGIKTTAHLLNVDYTKLKIYDATDAVFQNNIQNQFSPNIGAGLYYYSDKLYVGLSVPNFIKNTYYNDNTISTATEKMHYYFMGGYVFDLNESLKFKPAFLSKVVYGAPLQVDLTTNFMFFDKFELGAAWRIDAAVSGLAGFQINENWMIGYAYDAETTKLRNYNSGSHEIFLRYEFKNKSEKVVSPRFF